jgi:uncharacterized protein
VLFGGADYTVDGREPVTAEDHYRIGLHCWGSDAHRPAAAFFLEAAERAGHADAAELLGHADFVQGRYAAAVPRLLRSTGSPRAAHYLGTLHQRGCPEAGIAASYEEAAHWYRRAAALGEPESMMALGDLYLERLLRPARSPAEHALEHFLAAADLGHPYGQYRAAEVCRTLLDDPARAAALYRACAGNPRTPGHPLGPMMALQSRVHLGDLAAAQETRLRQARRDAVTPPHQRYDTY